MSSSEPRCIGPVLCVGSDSETKSAEAPTSGWLRVVISIGIFILALSPFVSAADARGIVKAMQEADLLYLALSIGLILSAMVLRSLRLSLLLGPRGCFRDAFHSQNICQLTNNLLPLRSGELVLALLLRNVFGERGGRALSVVALDRILDLAVILILFSLTLLVTPAMPHILRTAASVLVCIVLSALCLIFLTLRCRTRISALVERRLAHLQGHDHQLWARRLNDLIDGWELLLQPRRLIKVLALSVLVWLVVIGGCYFAALAVWNSATVAAAAFAVCLSIVGTSVVATPAGIGVMHASLALALAIFGAPQHLALTFAISYHAGNFAVSTALGIFSLNRLDFNLLTLVQQARSLIGRRK